MEFNINGIIYFDKESISSNKYKIDKYKIDKYELDEYRILKKWLIFKQKPKTLEEIKILELKVDLFIKKNIKNFEYNYNINLNNLNIEKYIPEYFYRYKSIFNNIIE
jgi:hypothetical protein